MREGGVRRSPRVSAFLVALNLCLVFHAGGISLRAGMATARPLPLTENIPVPGGTVALAKALGIDPPPLRAVFVRELVRHLHNAPEGESTGTDALVLRLTQYLEDVRLFQDSLASVQPGTGGIALALADQKNERRHLDDFLDLVGLRLHEKNRRFSVQALTGEDSAEPVPLLSEFGVDVGQLARRLNAGETVRLEVRTDLVPLPLSATTWSRAILRRTVPADHLFSAVMSDRQAALLAYGLSSLDDTTLNFLTNNPAVLRRLYEHDAAIFSAFGQALRVKDNRIVVPGGEAAASLWEGLVGEEASTPDKFIRELFAKRDGRLAYLYDAIAKVDEAHARFALGLWIGDQRRRSDRFTALANICSSAYDHFRPKLRPFSRVSADIGLLLGRVRVDAAGVPLPPNYRKLWEKAFDSVDLPDDASRQLGNVQEDGLIDAAWLASQVTQPDDQSRTERRDLLSFGQRAFGSASDSEMPDVLVALRGFSRFRTLMLTLDRMNVTAPSIYAGAAQKAAELSALDDTRAFVALAEFQSALALLDRLRLVRVINVATANQLVRSLTALRLSDGQYHGAVADWFDAVFIPAIQSRSASGEVIEERLLAALSGAGSSGAGEPRVVTWEDRLYQVDLAGAERRRLKAVRAKQGGNSLDQVLRFARDVRQLAAGPATVTDIQRIANAIATDAAPFTRETAPPRLDTHARRDPGEVITRALKELASIKTPEDIKKAQRLVQPLSELGDTVLSDTLLSIAYALDLGDPQGVVFFGGNPALGHDFGLTLGDGERRLRTPWALPSEVRETGVPWHVVGSVLGLDVGLSSLSLRRTASRRLARQPLLNSNDRITFVDSLALLNPFDLTDRDRDEIAAAIGRGRARVLRLNDHPEDLEGLAAQARSLGVDGGRQRAIRWTLINEPDNLGRWFSLSEVLAFGNPGSEINLDAWGMSAIRLEGCLCTRLAIQTPWQQLTGRAPHGLLSARVADLHLRVIEISAHLGLPAQLIRGVLSAAVEDYVHTVNPSDPDDWMTLVAVAQRTTKEAVEDYAAALVANGFLVEVSAPTRREQP